METVQTLSELMDEAFSAIENEDNIIKVNNDLILTVKNIPSKDFLRYANNENVTLFDETSINPPLTEEQVIFFLRCELTHSTIGFVTDSSVLVPYISNTNIKIRFYANGELIEKGYVADMYCVDTKIGITVFVPYQKDIKHYGIFTISPNGRKQYLMVGSCKFNEIIPSIILPPRESIRNEDYELTEHDRIKIGNTSTKRIYKKSEDWRYLDDALYDINLLFLRTRDPNYMIKLMNLNNLLSVSPQITTTEEISVV